MIQVYTDGSTRGNGTEESVGGYGVMIQVGKDKSYYSGGPFENTTNNRMELMGALEGCKLVKRYADMGESVGVYSDSAYLVNAYKQGWYIKWKENGWFTSKNTVVKNRDLWEELIPFFENPQYEFYKVKGHAGVKDNEMVDCLAKGASTKEKK